MVSGWFLRKVRKPSNGVQMHAVSFQPGVPIELRRGATDGGLLNSDMTERIGFAKVQEPLLR